MNNNKYSILGLLFVSLSMFGLPATATTPDGQTPAEETVCTPLKADGVSKGLYGLCVAFCEAQDYAEAIIPTTEADLERLESSAPSGKILANYNKRKQETDPPMPCIVAEPPCPCFSAEDLAEIDGDDSIMGCPIAPHNANFIIAGEPLGGLNSYTRGISIYSGVSCQHKKSSEGYRTYSVDSTITADELSACEVMLQTHIDTTENCDTGWYGVN